MLLNLWALATDRVRRPTMEDLDSDGILVNGLHTCWQVHVMSSLAPVSTAISHRCLQFEWKYTPVSWGFVEKLDTAVGSDAR